MFRLKKLKPFKKLSLKQKVLRIVKFVAGVIIFFTLPTLLLFGFIYLKYNEPMPQAIVSNEADILAKKMLDALDYERYISTNYIEFTFKGRQHYKWQKSENTCEVRWSDFKVDLNLKNINKSKVFVANQAYEGLNKQKLIKKAHDYFNNDTFWLVAPYKVFDPETERKLVITEENNQALLVTYNSGGTTPGDSYLWHLDKSGMPKSYKMWVQILPIEGLEATWNNWITTSTGTKLPTSHKLLFLDLEITNLKTQ